MRTAVFINAHSRKAALHLAMIRRYFARKKSGFDVLEFIVVEDLTRFDTYLDRLRAHTNAECVIVGSGDGTIVSVLNALKGRPVTYGFLPLGTGNTFVRSLGLPLVLKKALSVLGRGNTREASLGSVNDVLFANIADIGVPAHVAEQLTNRVKRYLGSLAYAVSGVRELARHQAIWCEVEIDGQTKSFYTHQLLVANGKYRGRVTVGQDTSAYSDTLTLGYSTSPGRWEYVKDVFSFLTRTTDKRKNLFLLPIQKAIVRTEPRQIIQADGEIIGHTPAKFKVIKNAIRVLAPPESARLEQKQ